MFSNNKYVFRFILIFFGLIIFPFPLTYIPYVNFIGVWISKFYKTIIPWLGNNVLSIQREISTEFTGSGDTTYGYLLILFYFCLAILGTIIWSLIARKHRNHIKLNYWFLTALRYWLGIAMLSYGLSKVVHLQMGSPNFYRLLEPYGDSSPMGLAWTYIGFSKGFSMFVGLAEVIGGILLFHRRTVIIGALLLLSVTANVVAVNYFFDVPVKIYSTQLLIATIIIIAPYTKRLFAVIFNYKETAPFTYLRIFKQKKWYITKLSIKWVFIAYVLFTNINSVISRKKASGRNLPRTQLYGLYETVDFIRNSDTIPPLLTDASRWRYLLIESDRFVEIRAMDESKVFYKRDTLDSIEKRIQWSNFRDSTEIHHFKYKYTDSTMTIEGIYKNDTLKVDFTRRGAEDFILMGRGFNWINERPFNR